MASLEGKVVVITGAASGIGHATAHLLASRGATLSLADIQQEALDTTVAEIQKSTPKAHVFSKVVDVVKGNEVAGWLDETIKQYGKIDGAANIAGIIGTTGKKAIKDLDDADWDSVLDVNLKGVFNCLRGQLQRVDKDASIVNMASVAGLKGYRTGAPYCASKHAVIGLTKSAAQEVGTQNIRVNCVAPGPIDTPMTRPYDGKEPGANGEKNRITSIIDGMKLCIARKGQPEEIASMIAFLLSDESKYTTGAVFTVDGGHMA